MKKSNELESILNRIDGRGYKAYKDISGQYLFDNFKLSIDYVQGDPFASPSRIRVTVPNSSDNFPKDTYSSPYKKNATTDFLSRTISKNIYRFYNRVGGSGKSGLLSVGHCGQEILERSYVLIDDDKVEVRLEVGLPASGRRILSSQAKKIFFGAIPEIVKESLFYSSIDVDKLISQVKLAEDQNFLRQEIEKRKLVSFIANGSILPRESGASQKPMTGNVVPFQSPSEYELEIELPNRGKVKGMGVPEGVTLIVGGGFHGKSTLLQAIELGVYDHIAGDGREYIVTRESAVKIKAEDGRSIQKVDISPFINNLPMGQETVRFSTENGSGSTSQAANIMEAIEVGTDLLLIDEDTSATNFMIRDSRMQELVSKEKEPITPFIDNVRSLYESNDISTVLVIGGSGDYFEVADHVIMMDEYMAKDVTEKAKDIVSRIQTPRKSELTSSIGDCPPRIISRASFPKGKKGVKIKSMGTDKILYNKTEIDLRNLEQLIDGDQTSAISAIMQYMMKHIVNDKLTVSQAVEKILLEIDRNGLDVISPFKGHPGNMALPRKYEIAGVLNRFRSLKIR